MSTEHIGPDAPGEAEAEARFEVSFENAATGGALIDLVTDPGRIERGNWALAQLAGLDPEDLPACHFVDLFDPADRGQFGWMIADLAAGRSAQARLDTRIGTLLGEERWVDVSLSAVMGVGGSPSHAIASVQLGARETFLAWQSTHDALTGLSDRAALTGRLAQSLANPVSAARLAVLVVNLDRFKAVNNQHGYATGDTVVTAVARRLEVTVRPGDLVAREGGDEFIILVERIRSRVDLRTIGQRIVDAIATPIPVLGGIVRIGASVGVACPGADADLTPDGLIDRAFAAMHTAKESGGSRYHVSDDHKGPGSEVAASPR